MLHHIVVSRKDGREDKSGAPYVVTDIVKGLTEMQAGLIRGAIHGRLTAPNRIDHVRQGDLLYDAFVGTEFKIL